MRCTFYKIVSDNGVKKIICTLFDGISVDWHTDCKKCIESLDVRVSLWNRLQEGIRNRLLTQIPNKWAEIDYCEHKGNVLPNVTQTETCCGGKIKEVPMFECHRDNRAVTEKECLECLAQRK